MTPTPEQEAIRQAAKNTRDSILVNALAGAAKTTTLCLIAQALPLEPTICVAFNKRIAEEMAKRLPSHVQSATLNSLGHRVWGAKMGRRLVLDTDKTYNALKTRADAAKGEDKKALGDAFTSILRAIRMAKSQGYIPKEFRALGQSLVDEEQLFDALNEQLDIPPDDWMLAHIDGVLELSIADSFKGIIDFDDQIYMSTLFGGNYPKFPNVLVDETQDLSSLNHRSIELMVGNRLIAVGDPNQSIYAFRGAHRGSMALLKERFNMTEMSLTVSFRCPQKIVERARAWVPDFKWAEGAKLGRVEHLPQFSTSDIPDGAAIICRNNAPLMSMALRLIRKGRTIKLLGSDIGKGLVAVLRKLGPGNTPQAEVKALIDTWRLEQLEKTHEARHHGIQDRAACLNVFAESGATLEEAIAFAEHLFNADGKIFLMTGHKSKGGEWDTVFHLNSFLIPSRYAKEAEELGDTGPMDQEKNLRYVIETRSKESLFLINLEDMV